MSLNVDDVRCTHILRDRKTSVAALDSTVDLGVTLLKEIQQRPDLLRSA